VNAAFSTLSPKRRHTRKNNRSSAASIVALETFHAGWHGRWLWLWLELRTPCFRKPRHLHGQYFSRPRPNRGTNPLITPELLTWCFHVILELSALEPSSNPSSVLPSRKRCYRVLALVSISRLSD
jgi:hypothetical protein